MIEWSDVRERTLAEKIQALYEHGTFVMSIRYYRHKINLYLLGQSYVEVFVNHKHACIDKICLMDVRNSRMKFYSDQIKLPSL